VLHYTGLLDKEPIGKSRPHDGRENERKKRYFISGKTGWSSIRKRMKNGKTSTEKTRRAEMGERTRGLGIPVVLSRDKRGPPGSDVDGPAKKGVGDRSDYAGQKRWTNISARGRGSEDGYKKKIRTRLGNKNSWVRRRNTSHLSTPLTREQGGKGRTREFPAWLLGH